MRTALKYLTTLVVLLLGNCLCPGVPPGNRPRRIRRHSAERDRRGLPSPALIEKRTDRGHDATGRCRIIDLRAGTYTLSFSLPGFNVVRRENIELAGSRR